MLKFFNKYKKNLPKFNSQQATIALIFVIFVLFGINTLSAIQRNYGFQERVDELKKEIEIMEQENTKLELEIEYLKTDTFVEQEAREKLNLRKPGENLVILPKRPPTSNTTISQDKNPTGLARIRKNIQDWQKFLFGF